ncbi:MAG: PA14 domain-containing protein [Phycisphaerales bacterium]
MRKLRVLTVAVLLAGMSSLASAQGFSENFDSYASGSPLHGQGGWKGWQNAQDKGAPTSSAYAYSGKNSVEVIGSADLVHEFALSGGRWEFVAMQYIPRGSTGNTMFILLNQYDDAATANDWSIQLNYNLATGTITAESQGGNTTTSVVYDRWVELKFRIDLDNNTCEWHYNGKLIKTHQWDDNNHKTLQAIDLFGNSASSVYYDDITITQYYQYKANTPSPADGAVGVPTALMKWVKGEQASYHNVYFGTSPELTEDNRVANMTSSLMYYHMAGLQPGVTYYWRVDEVEADKTTIHTGDVWSFTAMPLTAFSPNPIDGDKDLAQVVTLSWKAAKAAKKHHVYFAEDLDAVQAGDVAADKGITEETSFSTGLLRAGTTYYWRVDEIEADGDVQVGEVWSFTTLQPTVGGIVREWWMDITGTAVANLTGDPRFPNDPTGRELVDLLEGPTDWTDYYGSRLYGWLKPEKSGQYTFWIASDDLSELWLSTDDDPANVAMIASVTGWSSSRDFDNVSTYAGTNQKSAAITLTAGQKYYIEALMKEGGGGDNLAVAWQPPSEARAVIGGRFVDTFALLPLKAAIPSPEDGAVDAVQSPVLSWFAGEKAVEHDVYFGDDAEAVMAADTSSDLYQGRQSGTTFDADDLEWGKTYYWRVDEIDESDPASLWKGTVWNFTTADFISVDDFESYTDDIDAEETIWHAWIDGLTNGTGSYVGYENAANGTFAETTVVHGGGQSMPVTYDNTKSPYYSEVSRTWASVQNWTADGVTTLSLFVRGRTSGAETTLYVALEDSNGKTAVVSNPDTTVVISAEWIEWQIPLSSFTGVNAAKVEVMYIGVGSRTSPVQGGTGVVYIDDIRLVK